MREVTGPIIAIVLVLCAVFVPVAFLGGLAGELYRQFAVTIAIAVVISGIVALTLTPALCALHAEARARAAGPLLPLVQPLASRASPRATRTASRWMIRRGAHRRSLLFVGMVARHVVPVAHHAGQPRARRGPGLLHRAR